MIKKMFSCAIEELLLLGSLILSFKHGDPDGFTDAAACILAATVGSGVALVSLLDYQSARHLEKDGGLAGKPFSRLGLWIPPHPSSSTARRPTREALQQHERAKGQSGSDCGKKPISDDEGVNVMSYRPTISVYIDGYIADIGYYRNWYDENLFFEAVAIAALFHECKTIQEYKEKKFGCQKIFYLVDPEKFENTEENLKFFESRSELLILVDLTAKCIYISKGAKDGDELEAILSALDALENYGYGEMYRWTGLSRIEATLAGVPYKYDPSAYAAYGEPLPAAAFFLV